VWEDRGRAGQPRRVGRSSLYVGVRGGPGGRCLPAGPGPGLEVVFRSSEPGLLGLPWELMRDGAGPLALGAGGIPRSLPVADSAQMLEVPGGRLRVLMVISRPAGTADVG